METAGKFISSLITAGEAIGSINTLAETFKTLKGAVYGDEVKTVSKSEIDKLRKTVIRLNAVFVDARKRVGVPETTLRWLDDLKDFCIDAEDLIDEFDTCNSESEADGASSTSSRKRKRPLLDHENMVKKIKEIQEKYRLAVKRLQLSNKDGVTRKDREELTQPRLGASLRDTSLIVGMDDKKNEILKLILNHQAESRGTGYGEAVAPKRGGRRRSKGTSSRARQIASGDGSIATKSTVALDPVIAVIGAGGIGKTTLVRLVYNDPQVDDYDFKIWININREHDVTTITKEIIESITGSSCQTLSLDGLQQKLKELINGKKFLLVLDGVWSENFFFWETLRPPLMEGAKGSAVLVTSQSELALNNLRPLATIKLTGLEEQHSWSLFRSRAFGQGGNLPQLKEDIGREIVERCHGSPLAIISICEILYQKDDEMWQNVRDHMADPRYEERGVLSTLKISYDYLPYHLQQCLAFCYLFPNGYQFDKDKLVKLWIAVGLINHNGPNKAGGRMRSMEKIGNSYFESLRGRSFFQAIDGGRTKQKYKMPGLVHEFAESVCGNDCLRIESQNAIPEKESRNALYALLYDCTLDGQVLSKVKQSKRLRALMFLRSPSEANGHFLNFKLLRALYLGDQNLKEVPSSIGDLIHLRYLNLHHNEFEELPDSLTNLINLQVLELSYCEKLRKLPKDLGNLINLRHLGLQLDWEKYCTTPSELEEMPSGISSLTSLQTLSRFVVSARGCRIRELKDLNLHGELCISNLENIVDGSDAKEAHLESKNYLKNLILQWGCNIDPPNGVKDIMEKLRPPKELKSLWIMNYPGDALPNWLKDLPYIETLKVTNCEKLRMLIELPKLKNLSVKGCGELGRLPRMIDSLEKLEVIDCPNLSSLQNEISSQSS